MKPLIYTTPDCPYCHDLTDWLDDLGVIYDQIDASTMPEIEIVPETHIGDDVFVGYEPKQILKSLETHGLLKS